MNLEKVENVSHHCLLNGYNDFPTGELAPPTAYLDESMTKNCASGKKMFVQTFFI